MNARASLALWVGTLLIGASVWLSVGMDGGPRRISNDGPVVTSPEEWVKAVAAEGTGEVRLRVSPDVPPDRTEDVAEQTLTVESLGPLSAGALEALLASLDRQIEGDSKKLGSNGPRRSAVKQLEALMTMTVLMAVRERVTAGEYLTIKQGVPAPPIPKGCKSMELTPYYTASGEWATVFVLIDAKKVEGLEELQSSLRFAAKQDREERLNAWNSQDDAVRSEAIQRQIQLRIKAGEDPSKNLNSEEFAQYSGMELFLQELGVDMVPGRTVLYPR